MAKTKVRTVSDDIGPSQVDHSAFRVRTGALDEALADLSSAIELRADDAAALARRGIVLAKCDRLEDALPDFNRSLKLQPDQPDTLQDRGIIHGRLGRHEEALSDFERALELRPDVPGPIYNRACVLSLTGRIEEALDEIRRAVAMDRQYADMAAEDADFDNVRQDAELGPRFTEAVGR